MKIYCAKCGNGVAYTSEKPNFCVKCGTPFAGSVAQASELEGDASEGDEPSGAPLPKINKLDFEIIDDVKSPKITFGSILEDAKRQDAPPQDDPSYQAPEMSTEEAMEEFKREAGTLRPNHTKDG
jgi:hypothetical protein|tara:strand:+ start:194 stop:568 length:375 start_codon:yes stop_codon:yes gene_type:complete